MKRPAGGKTGGTTGPRCFPSPLGLLIGSSVALAQATMAATQPTTVSSQQSVAADQDDDDIVVRGKPPRGSVVGDIRRRSFFARAM